MKNSIYTLILLISFYSCSKEKNVEDINTINSDIKVTLIEELSEAKNVLNINSETIEQQPCFNTSLISKHELNGDKIQIEYNGIYTPEICLTAIGSARTGYSFDLSEGEYSIEFLNDKISNYASLHVDNEKYIIELLSAHNILTTRDTLFKIPTNTYWGSIGYHQENSKTLVDDFIDSLIQLNVDFKSYKNGDYGYFIISQNEIQSPTNHGYYFIKPIIFEYNGDFIQFKTKVLQYAETHKDELSIYLMNYQGKEISIWN